MMPSNMGGGSSGAKHQQQLIQSVSLLPTPYGFLPSVFGGASLDMPLLGSVDPNVHAMYLSQLAAAMGQAPTSQDATGASTASEQRRETTGETKMEPAASTSSEAVTSSCSDESPTTPKPNGAENQEQGEQDTAESATLSPTKVGSDDVTPAMSQNEGVGAGATASASASELPNAVDLPKWISDFLPGIPNGGSALSMAALSQRMPSLLEQIQLVGQYLNPGAAADDPLRMLTAAALAASSSTGTVPPTTNSSSAPLLNSAFASSTGQSKDAYCEMCDKKFCNRYFLRTHKWKKHGVQMPDKNSPPAYNIPLLASQACSLDLPTTSTGTNFNPAELLAAMCRQSETQTSQLSPSKATCSQPTSVIVNCSNSPASPLPKRARLDDNDEGNKSDEETSITTRSPVQFRSNNVKHEEESVAGVTSQLPNTGDLIAMLARQAQENVIAQGLLSLNTEGLQAQQQPSPSKQSSSGKEEHIACEVCGQDCEGQDVLQHHLLQHTLSGLLHPSLPLNLLQLGALQSQQQQNVQGSDADRSHNSGIVPGVITPPINSRQPKKQYTTGKNYCDVCNKEVCNKYFLRTHMLKMHGIVIDEHKTVIANIDTLEKEKSGTIAFRCDICNTNVGQTRESLKQHKQEVHNVVSLPTPRGHRGSVSSTSSLSNTPSTVNLGQNLKNTDRNGSHTEKLYVEELRCPLCGRSSSGLVAMQEHFQTNHQMNLAPEMVQDIIKGASEIISGRNVPAVAAAAELQQHLTARNQFSCAKCPQTFGDQVSLELHGMHCHPVILHGLENPESAAETTHKVESLYPQCGDRTPSVEDGEKYHTESRGWTNVVAKSVNGNGSGDGKREVFDCPVLCCPRRYHNPVILNKHVDVIHQWRLKFSPKGGVNKPHGAFRKVIRKRKPYICLFEGCSCRFWTRADRHQHILSHLFEADGKGEGNATGIPESEVKLTNGDAVGVKKGLVLRKMESESAKREQEHNSHTTSPSSPDSDGMPEGYGRPSVTSKPYTMQTFLMRERASEGSPTSTSDSATAFNEMIAYLPVRSTVHERIRVDVELVPLTQQNARIVHL